MLRTITTQLGTAQVIGYYEPDRTKVVVQYPRGTAIPQEQRIPGLSQSASFALEAWMERTSTRDDIDTVDNI